MKNTKLSVHKYFQVPTSVNRPELGGTRYLGPFRTDHEYIQNKQEAGKNTKINKKIDNL